MSDDLIDGYLSRGWAIFPCYSIVRGRCSCPKGEACTSPGKHPMIRDGVKGATSDPATIESWRRIYPNANWAVACGEVSGVVVLDVDSGKGGFESLESLGLTDPTLTAFTGGRGLHLYFRYETGLKNRVGALPGLDFRSDGGYVILPGSHHVSGGTYRWRIEGDPAPLPDVVRQVVESRGSTEHDALTDSASILEGVPEGKRDDTLFRWACRLRRQHSTDADGGRAIVTTLVLAAAERSNFPRAEALQKVEQAYRQDHADDLPTPFAVSTVDRLVGGGAFVFDEPEETPAIWGEGERILWAEGEGLMIVGHQGLGKTTIGQQLVLARLGVREPEFLDLPVKQSAGQTLYLAMDRPRQAARSLRRMVTPTDRDVLDERLKFWRGPLPIEPLRKGELLAWVREVCPDIDTLIVDSLKDVIPDLNDAANGAALNSAFQSIITDGIDLLLLHHERKADGKSKRTASLDNVYGSTWLTSGLGSVIALLGEPGSAEVGLHHLKQPADVVGPLTVIHDHPSGTTSVQRQTTMTVEGALMLSGGNATVKGLMNLTGLSERRVRRALDEFGDRLEVIPPSESAQGRQPAKYRLVA